MLTVIILIILVARSLADTFAVISTLHNKRIPIDGVAQSIDELIKLFYDRNPKISYEDKEDVVSVAALIKIAKDSEQAMGVIKPAINELKRFVQELYSVYQQYKANNVFPIARLMRIPVPDGMGNIPYHNHQVSTYDGTNRLNDQKQLVEGPATIQIGNYISFLIEDLIKVKYPKALRIGGFGSECEKIVRDYSGIVDDEFYKAVRSGLFS